VWPFGGASAKAAGLRTRPFGDSVLDTWQWLQSGGEVRTAPGTPSFGLAGSKEQQVLAAWESQPSRPGNLIGLKRFPARFRARKLL
jgi:2'-hydroxyisoflavone reductase